MTAYLYKILITTNAFGFRGFLKKETVNVIVPNQLTSILPFSYAYVVSCQI